MVMTIQYFFLLFPHKPYRLTPLTSNSNQTQHTQASHLLFQHIQLTIQHIPVFPSWQLSFKRWHHHPLPLGGEPWWQFTSVLSIWLRTAVLIPCPALIRLTPPTLKTTIPWNKTENARIPNVDCYLHKSVVSYIYPLSLLHLPWCHNTAVPCSNNLIAIL